MAQFSELKRKSPFPLLFLGFGLKKALVVFLCKPLAGAAALPGDSGVPGRGHGAEVRARPVTSALALQRRLRQLCA